MGPEKVGKLTPLTARKVLKGFPEESEAEWLNVNYIESKGSFVLLRIFIYYIYSIKAHIFLFVQCDFLLCSFSLINIRKEE
jgi:hypothetical protein